MTYVYVVMWVSLIYIMYKLVRGTLFEGVHLLYKRLIRATRPWYVFEAFGLAMSNALLTMTLKKIEWMNWSVFSMFGLEGGNVLNESIGSAGVEKHGLGFTLCFLILLMILTPVLAFIEEWIFRKRFETWGSIVGMSLLFGVAHGVGGVSLGPMISLCLVGLYLGARYKDRFDELKDSGMDLEDRRVKATLRSTLIHSLHNYVFFVLVLIRLVQGGHNT